ncbi:UROD/MetE-like protein [Dacryopinax primogenitus]|uniref:UROD/MetE-like protein n=1 Tax=Dacryopinax primogenitus (strain DJM 731) TaxID=1858805 RepID=M5G3W3_DACPD|nr:UROD/MetE-like protein [Dacryopinax primogenitus]EJU00537.1 UROD/MetE-like protein [Dacryopinax primogenitus]
MPIPTEVVGSLPRPTALQHAFAQYDAGIISKDELFQAQDQAAEDSVKRMIQTGETYVTDGEQRTSSFATYPVVDTLGGKGLASTLRAGGQYFAIFADGHHRQLPSLISGPFRYSHYAYDNFKKSKPYSGSHPMKTAVIAPSMLYLLYSLNEEVAGRCLSRIWLTRCKQCEKDIRGCFAAGAQRVSIDFTEGRLAAKNDPRNPWTGAHLLKTFIDLNNKVLDRFTAEERKNIGVHTCPGGDCDSVHSLDVDYHELLPSLFQMNAGYFLIELASEKDKAKVYKEIGKTIRSDANGVKQVAFVGVINPLNPEVETPEHVCEALLEAAKYIPKDQLGATDDCGFSPFSIDVKPKHGSPDFARDVAFQKIANRVKGAKMASEKLGI